MSSFRSNYQLKTQLKTQPKKKSPSPMRCQKDPRPVGPAAAAAAATAGSADPDRHWDAMFEQLRAFQARHGHCRVPRDRPEDAALGAWLWDQWRRLAGAPASDDRRRRLGGLGVVWEGPPDAALYGIPPDMNWDVMCWRLQIFHKHHGHSCVPPDFPPDPALGHWVAQQRRALTAAPDTHVRKQMLDRLGFVWGTPKPAEKDDVERRRSAEKARALRSVHLEFLHRHTREGDSRQPLRPEAAAAAEKETPSTSVAVEKKEAPSTAPTPAAATDEDSAPAAPRTIKSGDERAWDEMFQRLVEFKEEHGHCQVPVKYPEYPPLGYWVDTQRRKFPKRPGMLERRRRLDSIGFVWQVRSRYKTKRRILEEMSNDYKHMRRESPGRSSKARRTAASPDAYLARRVSDSSSVFVPMPTTTRNDGSDSGGLHLLLQALESKKENDTANETPPAMTVSHVVVDAADCDEVHPLPRAVSIDE